MKNYVLGLFCVLALCCNTASARNSYFYFTNNTSEALELALSANTTKHWQGHAQVVAPFHRVKALTISRDSLKKDERLEVELSVLDPKSKAQLMKDRVTVVGRSLYGSKIHNYLKVPGSQEKQVLENDGIEHYPVTSLHKTHLVHGRSYLPSGELFSSYQFVYDDVVFDKPPTEEANELKLLSYNTKLLPFYADIETYLNHPNERAAHIPNYIKTFDVVVLQELFDRDNRNKIAGALMAHYPYQSDVVGHHEPGKVLSGGVKIFSRYPIVRTDEVIYSQCSGWDCGAAKGVIYAKISKNGKNYHVFGTHLQAGGKTEKAVQLKEFEDFIFEQEIPNTEPVIVLGDFNIKEGSSLYPLLKEELGAKPIKLSNIGVTSASFNTMHDDDDKSSRIDYIMPIEGYLQPSYSDNVVKVYREFYEPKLWNDFDLSDHFAVSATFKYE